MISDAVLRDGRSAGGLVLAFRLLAIRVNPRRPSVNRVNRVKLPVNVLTV
jgi:hypothetical protein